MTDALTHAVFRGLVERTGDPLLTLMMPTHARGGLSQEDRVRFRTLLRRADRKLAARSMRPPERRAFLAPLHAIARDALFWRHCSDGLAVFVGDGSPVVLRVPRDLPSMVHLGTSTWVAPLVPLLPSRGAFAILALHLHDARLIIVSGDRTAETTIRMQHADVRTAYGIEHSRVSLQQHRAGDATMFHGHGAWKDHRDSVAEDHVRAVDREVIALLSEHAYPLVLAADPALYGLYRSVTSYPHLLDRCIEGNPAQRSADTLAQDARDCLQEIRGEEAASILASFGTLSAQGKTSVDAERIVPAAKDGAVDTLLLPDRMPGRARRTGSASFRRTRVDDCINSAVIATVQHRGNVLALPPDRMPRSASLAALFRF